MKLSKALEILDINILEAGKKMPADTLTALELGVASIVRLQSMRTHEWREALPLLSGETPEGESP